MNTSGGADLLKNIEQCALNLSAHNNVLLLKPSLGGSQSGG